MFTTLQGDARRNEIGRYFGDTHVEVSFACNESFARFFHFRHEMNKVKEVGTTYVYIYAGNEKDPLRYASPEHLPT